MSRLREDLIAAWPVIAILFLIFSAYLLSR
jgi:hypothetical protein